MFNGLRARKGKIIVSVFNKQRFIDYGINVFYKHEVAPTVGGIREDPEALRMRKRGILLTDRGVYSQWFSEEDLEKRFKVSGLSARIRTNESLPTFEKETSYIDKRLQDEVKKTVIIAESDVG